MDSNPYEPKRMKKKQSKKSKKSKMRTLNQKHERKKSSILILLLLLFQKFKIKKEMSVQILKKLLVSRILLQLVSQMFIYIYYLFWDHLGEWDQLGSGFTFTFSIVC